MMRHKSRSCFMRLIKLPRYSVERRTNRKGSSTSIQSSFSQPQRTNPENCICASTTLSHLINRIFPFIRELSNSQSSRASLQVRPRLSVESYLRLPRIGSTTSRLESDQREMRADLQLQHKGAASFIGAGWDAVEVQQAQRVAVAVLREGLLDGV